MFIGAWVAWLSAHRVWQSRGSLPLSVTELLKQSGESSVCVCVSLCVYVQQVCVVGERERKDWLWAVKASRNKLSPRTAGQGVSESSLAGCLHTGRRRHQEKGERKKKKKHTNKDWAKTHLHMLCQFRCNFFVCSISECKTENTAAACVYVSDSVNECSCAFTCTHWDDL